MSEIDEQTLVEQAKEDPEAFAQLYNLHVDRIFAYTYRQLKDEALAKDMTAITFEKALRHLRGYEWQGKSFCAWLYRIARNEIISYQRKQRLITPLANLGKWWKSETNVEAEVQANAQRSRIQDAMQKLSSKDQELLSLRFYEELPSKEIAEILGYTENNVNVRLHRALKRLRIELIRGNLVQGAEYVS